MNFPFRMPLGFRFPNWTPWLARLLVAAIIGLGLWYSARGANDLWLAWQSAAWPSVRGEITGSKVERNFDSNGNAAYYPRLEFVYVAEGERHTSHARFIGDDPAHEYGQQQAEAVVRRYPPGPEGVRVYYDPEMPERGVLEVGISKPNWFTLHQGVGLLMLAGWATLFLWANDSL